MDALPPTIARYIDAYNARDVDAMLACLSSEIRFINRFGGQTTVETKGKAEFAALAEQARTAFSERCQTVTNCIAADGAVALRITYRAVVAADLPNGWVSGQVIEMTGSSFFMLEGDSIAELVDIA